MIKIASSIPETNNTGSETDFKTNNIMIKIIPIDAILTFLKSSSAILTKSFMHGPSPAIIAFLSYFLIIWSISSITLFNLLVAISSVELTNIIL